MFEVLCLVVISMRSLFCVSRMDFVKYLNIYSTLSLSLALGRCCKGLSDTIFLKTYLGLVASKRQALIFFC